MAPLCQAREIPRIVPSLPPVKRLAADTEVATGQRRILSMPPVMVQPLQSCFCQPADPLGPAYDFGTRSSRTYYLHDDTILSVTYHYEREQPPSKERNAVFSYVDRLECTGCTKTYSHSQAQRTCVDCGMSLFARYDLEKLRRDVDRDALKSRTPSMWRFSELLPVLNPENVVTLGEGGTPLLQARNLGRKLGLKRLYIKDEGLNPTATFKARGFSAAVSKARELGLRRFTDAATGNAAGALATYAARGGLEAHVFLPHVALDATRKETTAAGASVTMVRGTKFDATRRSRAAAEETGLFSLATFREPYRVEGKKTMGLEMAMQLGWCMPDAIVYPTGGGTGIVGMWKGFYELLEMGWVEGKLPKLIAVQPEGCHPIVRAFQEGAESPERWEEPVSIADGIRVPEPFGGYLVLRAVRDTGGTAITVTDEEMKAAIGEMASSEGVFPCPEGAAPLAGLRRLLEQGAVSPDESIILLNTGSGYKQLEIFKDDS